MDLETAEALDTLRSDIRGVEGSLTDKIARIETSLTAEVGRVETSLTARINHVETSLTATMRELNEDAKRHTDVRLERMRDDIRLLAEGFASLSIEGKVLSQIA
jgi:hypothetical protein